MVGVPEFVCESRDAVIRVGECHEDSRLLLGRIPATESTLAIRCMQEWREAVRANLMALNRMRLTVAEAEARV